MVKPSNSTKIKVGNVLGAFGLTTSEQTRILFTVGNWGIPVTVVGSVVVHLLQLGHMTGLLQPASLCGVSCIALPAMYSLGLQICFYVASFFWLGSNIVLIVDNGTFILLPLPLALIGVISLYILHWSVLVLGKLRRRSEANIVRKIPQERERLELRPEKLRWTETENTVIA